MHDDKPVIRTKADEQAIADGCYWDEAAGQRVLDFLQTFVTLESGEKLVHARMLALINTVADYEVAAAPDETDTSKTYSFSAILLKADLMFEADSPVGIDGEMQVTSEVTVA